MNGLCGMIRFDGQPILAKQLNHSLFQSPYWQPDHQQILIKDSVGLSCTQRFITPQCSSAPMPLHHPETGCLLVADAYLTHREELIEKLELDEQSADSELILSAYLAWGNQCTQHLSGLFMFALWDPGSQTLLLATDHYGQHPCLYHWQPGKYLIFANTMQPFEIFCPKLTLNDSLFMSYSLDAIPFKETCYQEVNRLLPATQIQVRKNHLETHRYWTLNQQKRHLTYKTREDYYQAFQEKFSIATQNCLRSQHPVLSHVSGGLDSSSVTAMSAKLLLEQQRNLHAFTAIPLGLTGESYRRGWQYNEIPLIQALLAKYPNIIHTVYTSDPQEDIFKKLQIFYPFIDQPVRNVFNFDWVLAAFEKTHALGGRTLLHGQHGNASISYVGENFKGRWHRALKNVLLWLNPLTPPSLQTQFAYHHPDFLQTKETKKILRHRNVIYRVHDWMLSRHFGAPLQTSVYPITLWYGVQFLDPTSDLSLIEFCYNTPEWVYFKGKNILDKRLLVREGLKNILPEAIRFNPYRGEQAADAYLQYNQHRINWEKKLRQISDNPQQTLLWQLYDQEKIHSLFATYPTINAPSRAISMDIYCTLARCLSLAFYLDFRMTLSA